MEVMNLFMESKLQNDTTVFKSKGRFSDTFTKEYYENEISGKEVRKFLKSIKSGEEDSVSWDNAVFESYKIERTEKISDSIEIFKGDIFFSSGNRKYKTSFKSIVCYNNTLFGISLRRTSRLLDIKDQNN